MSDSIPVARRSRRSLRPGVRSAAAGIMVAGLALLVAACGGSSSTGSLGSPGVGGSTNSPSAVGYSACMRSHGVPSFPDPDSSGQLPKGDAQQFGVSSSQLQSAQGACQRLLPDTGGSFEQQARDCFLAGACPQALVQKILNVQRKYSRCMRSRKVPNWPDPTIDSQGRPGFIISTTGINTGSSQWRSSDAECERLVGIDGDVPVDVG